MAPFSFIVLLFNKYYCLINRTVLIFFVYFCKKVCIALQYLYLYSNFFIFIVFHMRFFSWFSRITLLLLLFVGVTSASTGDLWSWMDNLNSAPFGYTLSQQVTVTQVTPTSVTISSPALQDDLGNKITKYTVMYSENPLSKILETPALLDQSLEKTFDFPVVN